MNTMFAAVQSRTAEIGTLRSLGFPARAILRSFVIESVTIALVGCVVGLALSVAATAAITAWLNGIAFNLSTFTTAVARLRVTPGDAAVAFALSLCLGLGGGFLPARRAARLSPAEALRRG
jgi:putative ABC transport system permease protein